MSRDEVIRELQERFRQAGRSLNELERRHWAATEAIALGRGGITIVSQALRMSPNTIKRGMQELMAGQASRDNLRIRRVGGGRKSKTPSSDNSTRGTSRRAMRRKA